MSTQNRSQSKGGKPEGLEDKALAPVTEDKAVEPAKADETDEPAKKESAKVALTLKAHYRDKSPGESIEVDPRTAANLVREQIANLA